MNELRERSVESTSGASNSTERRAVVRRRSESVRVYVLRRSNGVCEECGEDAPFLGKKGRPYLEPHHITRVADGGPDDPRSVGALCPNCHREIHYGERGDEINTGLAAKLKMIEP